MKFGKYILSQKATLPADWSDEFLNYKGLKDRIKNSAEQEEASGTAGVAYSPRETSLSVARHRTDRDAAEESFFELLEAEVSKVGAFTAKLVEKLKQDIKKIQGEAEDAAPEQYDALRKEAKTIGDEFLALEKYVNLNYLGFHKAVKKHDKLLPLAPCQQFYMHVLRNQPWVQGDHSELLVHLSSVYSKLRDPEGAPHREVVPGLLLPGNTVKRSLSYAGSDFDSIASLSTAAAGATKAGLTMKRYWVRMPDVSAVRHHIVQHLGVASAAQGLPKGETVIMNALYLDNTSLELYHNLLDKKPAASSFRIRWTGAAPGPRVILEHRIHDGNEKDVAALPLAERSVVPFLQGSLSEQAFVDDLRSQQSASSAALDDAEVWRLTELFTDIQRVVSAKQLVPTLRTQVMRSAYGSSGEGDRQDIHGRQGLRVLFDTNIVMIRENPYSAMSSERWARDIGQLVPRTEMTKFPHAVLDIQMSAAAEHSPPSWLEELGNSGYVTEVYSFSKMLHGIATLLPDSLQAVPFWVDDESVRASMAASGPSPPRSIQGHNDPARLPGGGRPVRRAQQPALEGMIHPLLGPAPTLQLMPDRTDITGFNEEHAAEEEEEPSGCLAWWFLHRGREKQLDSLHLPLLSRSSRPVVVPPKNVLALERTYLAWVHMALTVGAIAAAIAGVSGDNKEPTGKHAATKKGIDRSEDAIAMIMMVMAAAIVSYALRIYLQRSKMLTQEANDEDYMADRKGITAIVAIVVGSLSAILIIGIVDFFLMF